MKTTKSKPSSSKEKIRRSEFISKKEADRYQNDPYMLSKHEEARKFLDKINWEKFRELIKTLENK